MFLHLLLKLGKRGFGATESVRSHPGGMKRASRKIEIHREIELRFAGCFFQRAMQIHQICCIAFQKTIQLLGVTFGFMFNVCLKLGFDVAVCYFHSSTLVCLGLRIEGVFALKQGQHSALRSQLQPNQHNLFLG